MSLKSLVFSGVSKLIDSTGNAIDKLVTSDEERLKIKAAMVVEINKFKAQQLKAAAEYDKEISKRHASDMNSDSWLSKNIRPLALAFLTVSTVVLAYLSIFILDKSDVDIMEPWIDLLKVLLVVAYSFYFGSRTIEKVKRKKE